MQKIRSAFDLVAEMLLIFKYIIFDLIIQDQVLDYDRPKKCPTILYGANLWLKLSGTLAMLVQAALNAATAFG